jgi:predicted porin
MKKSLLALAALTAFAGVASAQSSVTLFGIVDLSVNNVKNGSLSQKRLSSDQLNSNRLGFRGVEDLGGGMRAGFWLEGAMSNDDGNAGGQTWQRRSTVSLMGGFGEVRMGRDYTPSFWNYTVFDPFGTNGLGSALNLVSTLGSGATTLVRANNSVGYFLPAMGGVYGQVQVAAGEGSTVGNKYVGGRLGYAGGPVNVAVALGKTAKDGGLADDYQDINFGASFKMSFMSIMGTYSKRDFLTRDQKNIMVGVTVPFGQSTLKASYNKGSGTQGTSATDFDATQIAFGYQYDLSKRTAIYATVSSLDNGGTAAGSRFVVGAGPAMTTGGAKSSGYNLGVRHSF